MIFVRIYQKSLIYLNNYVKNKKWMLIQSSWNIKGDQFYTEKNNWENSTIQTIIKILILLKGK